MEELWVDIKGWEGYYQVSNSGNVRSVDRYVPTSCSKSGKRFVRGRVLKPGRVGDYLMVNLTGGGHHGAYLIHRLVAIAFIPNPKNLPCVDHKDNNKQNCWDWNLEWVTHSDNMYRAYATGVRVVTEAQIGKGRKCTPEQKARMRHGKQDTRNAVKATSKRVRCLNNGIIYKSMAQAYRELGVDVYYAISANTSIKGYSFELV